jgi:hypothetical protein
MDPITGNSGHVYAPLPIDGNLGFPQAFPLVFGGRTYRFRLYVNIAPFFTADSAAILDLPQPDAGPFRVQGDGTLAPLVFDIPVPQAFLVVRVDQDQPGGTTRLIFLRKVVPNLEYQAGDIALTFTQLRVAVKNLNGQGAFGSLVIGGIAPRWA